MDRGTFLRRIGIGLLGVPVLPVFGKKIFELGSGEVILPFNSESFNNLRINDKVILPGDRSYVVTWVWPEWVKLGSLDSRFPNVRLNRGDRFYLIPNLKGGISNKL